MNDDFPDWLKISDQKNQVLLKVYVQPGAKVEGIAGEHMGHLKIKISSPPVDGAANEAITKFIAQKLGIRASFVRLLSGKTARQKVISVDGMNHLLIVEKLLL
jgi:uncharacterized protein (TIGR00251 family)